MSKLIQNFNGSNMRASYQAVARATQSLPSLRKRVGRLFTSVSFGKDPRQQSLDLHSGKDEAAELPTSSLYGFIDFLASATPHGEVYLFGGVLRDLALYGRRGFDSDVDVVVEGGWPLLEKFLEEVGARKNRFGGYRLFAGDWPIDVWNAEDTWAIRNHIVPYEGISSLIKTTVLNWDAILMNWRTGGFICRPQYLDELRERSLDVVLVDNPNPIGMAVRVLRHLSSKDAKRIGLHAVEYLESVTEKYQFKDLVEAELQSYGASFIEPAVYRLFSISREIDEISAEGRFNSATNKMGLQGDGLAWKQLNLAIAIRD